MIIFIFACAVMLWATTVRLAYTAGMEQRGEIHKALEKAPKRVSKKQKVMGDIGYNIDHYDGTELGQKEVDADEVWEI